MPIRSGILHDIVGSCALHTFPLSDCGNLYHLHTFPLSDCVYRYHLNMSQLIDTNVVTYFCVRNHLLWMYGVWKHCSVLDFDYCSKCITSIIHSESVSVLEVWSYILIFSLGRCLSMKTMIAKIAMMRGIARFVVSPCFRGRRGLSAHLGRSQQECSASSEVLGDNEGPPCRWSVDSFPNTRWKE